MQIHKYYVTAPLIQLRKLAGALVDTMTEFSYNAGQTIKISTVQELPEKVLHEIGLIRTTCPKLKQRFNVEHYVTEE